MSFRVVFWLQSIPPNSILKAIRLLLIAGSWLNLSVASSCVDLQDLYCHGNNPCCPSSLGLWFTQPIYAKSLDIRGGHTQSTGTTYALSEHSSTLIPLQTDNSYHETEYTHQRQDQLNATSTLTQSSGSSLSFSIVQAGDGSEQDPDGIPTRYLLMQKGNRQNALQAFQATKTWREKNDVDHILLRPHPKYDIFKAVFPVYLADRDPTGHIIVVQQVGKIDYELAQRNHVSMDDVLMHYIYVIEYCWNILDKPPHSLPSSSNSMPVMTHNNAVTFTRAAGSQTIDGINVQSDTHPNSWGSMVTIMDCEGLTMSSMLGFSKSASENRKFLIKFVQTMSEHYPLRSYKTLIVNAPSWVHTIYQNLIRPLLRDSTRDKIQLLHGGKEQEEMLKHVLGISHSNDNIMGTRGHVTSGSNIDESDFLSSIGRNSSLERQLRNFALTTLSNAGESMHKVI